jgi:hypothetical protein
MILNLRFPPDSQNSFKKPLSSARIISEGAVFLVKNPNRLFTLYSRQTFTGFYLLNIKKVQNEKVR